MPAISKAWVTIADGAVDPDSPLDATLMTGLRDNQVHIREWLGASFTAGAVQDHNHDGANSALIEIGPNLVRNGSFENDGSGWTITDYTGGSHAFSTSTRHHGAKSLAITSTVLANGGGDALTNEFMPVAGSEWYDWGAQLSASVANVSSRVSIVWYDAAKAQISEVNVYDIASTPTTKTRIGMGVQAPASARYAKLRVKGGVPGAGSATGTIFFDGVSFSLAGELVRIAKRTASNSASIQFNNDGFDGSFDEHVVVGVNVVPANDNVDLYLNMSVNGGSSYDSGASSYAVATSVLGANGTNYSTNSTGTSNIGHAGVNNGISNVAAGGGVNFMDHLFKLRSTSQAKYVKILAGYSGNVARANVSASAWGIGTSNALVNAAVNGLNYQASVGTIASGDFYLYGRRSRDF